MKKIYSFCWWMAAWVTGIILYFYHPHDATWWYCTSHVARYHHPLGWVGATLAAFGYMALGVAACMIPGVCVAVGVCYHFDLSRERISRIIICFGSMLVSVAVLGEAFHCGSWGVPAGGALGYFVYVLLSDSMGRYVTAYLASCAVGIAGASMLGKESREALASYVRYSVLRYMVLPVKSIFVQRKDLATVHPRSTLIPAVQESEERSEPEQRKRTLPRSIYRRPPLSAVWGDRVIPAPVVDHTYHEQARSLEQKLEQFSIKGKVVNVVVGPVVVLFEYQPLSNVPVNKILAREHDLALALEATSFRIIAPIPGKALVGFECSRVHKEVVLFSDYYKELLQGTSRLPLLIGVSSAGKPLVFDLATLPHLLVAGSTGSGKSVVLHTIITSIISSRTSDETRVILIDPKRLEFAVYADIAHLLFPVVVEPREAIKVLRWLVNEMERRYQTLAQARVTDIGSYRTQGGQMPDIVMVIDEWADLMMTGGKDAEQSLVRLAQMARAAGIHVVIATQRPSVDVITGLIKVNIPARIACKVISKIDSRTIIDSGGAEKLLGKGDMLIMLPGSALMRAQGMYVSLQEVEEVTCYLRRQQVAVYQKYGEAHTSPLDVAEEDVALYNQVLDVIKLVDEVSISFLQRKLRIGYNRSARMIDYLEAHGIILPSDGGKTRKVVHSKDNI